MSSEPNHERFTVHYRITVKDGRSIEAHARDIAVEQTVEIPPDTIPKFHQDQGLPGRTESISQIESSPGIYDVTISYRTDVTAFSVPQFLNTLFGNISLKNNIRITDLELPISLANAFPGPTYGIDGLRALVGVYERPLVCTVLKPMGSSPLELAKMADEFAQGGTDFLKDDHGIGNQHFHPFEDRVARCQEAVDRVNARTGRNAIYLPMISGKFDEIDKQVQFAVRHGVKGILCAPMLVGFDAMRYFAQTYGIVIIGHPALTGTFVHDATHGISHAVMLGTLFRLAGADASIFPNSGGRFPFSPRDCESLCNALRNDHPVWKRAFPAPAGGMGLDRINDMAQQFGVDTLLLMGGALLQEGAGIRSSTAKFLDAVRQRFGERLEKPTEMISACEWAPPETRESRQRHVLKFFDFTWDGKPPLPYKTTQEIAFKGVSRQELITTGDSNTSFDLRYFEVEPGGYTSLEKHVHEHVIIGVRGKGIFVSGEDRIPLGTNDVAYTAPSQKHQLRNESREPFGFYCIVDRMRDKPKPA